METVADRRFPLKAPDDLSYKSLFFALSWLFDLFGFSQAKPSVYSHVRPRTLQQQRRISCCLKSREKARRAPRCCHNNKYLPSVLTPFFFFFHFSVYMKPEKMGGKETQPPRAVTRKCKGAKTRLDDCLSRCTRCGDVNAARIIIITVSTHIHREEVH